MYNLFDSGELEQINDLIANGNTAPYSFGIRKLPVRNELLGITDMFDYSWYAPQVAPSLHENEGGGSWKAGPPSASEKIFTDRADPWDPLRILKSQTASSMTHGGASLDSGYFSGTVVNNLEKPDEERNSTKSAKQIEDDCLTDLTLGSRSTIRTKVHQPHSDCLQKLIMEDGGFERSNFIAHIGNQFNNGTLTFKVSKGRRRRALNEDERQHAKLVRKIGACDKCRKRKSKVCIRWSALKTLKDL